MPSRTKLAAIGVVPPLERQGTSDAGDFGATFKLHYSLKLTTDLASLLDPRQTPLRPRLEAEHFTRRSPSSPRLCRRWTLRSLACATRARLRCMPSQWTRNAGPNGRRPRKRSKKSPHGEARTFWPASASRSSGWIICLARWRAARSAWGLARSGRNKLVVNAHSAAGLAASASRSRWSSAAAAPTPRTFTCWRMSWPWTGDRRLFRGRGDRRLFEETGAAAAEEEG